MKTIKLLSLSLVATLLFSACSDDDDAPVVINEEEEITTVNVILTPENGDELTFTYRDLDGGDTAPEVDPIVLQANTTYTGRLEFLNENEEPVEDKTTEIREEDEDHQVFFIVENGLNAATEYLDFDGNNDPLGTEFSLVTREASTGNLTFLLIHEGDKSTPEADGETDIEAVFENVTIE